MSTQERSQGRVAGKVAFITGAARGQGRAEAVRFAEEGADIVAFDICGPIAGREMIPAATRDDLAETERLVKELGRRVLAVVGDIRNFADLEDAVAGALTEFGRIDIVVANAATTGVNVPVHQISAEDWQTTIDVNLTGTFNTIKAVLPTMIEAGRGGSIVLIGSGAAMRAMPNLGEYGASKVGVFYLAEVLAMENGVHGIRVNAIAPGNVKTPMIMNDHIYKAFRPDLDKPTFADVEPTFAAMSPLTTKTFVDPRDIANAVLWLASDEAACVTGVILPVDMGFAAG